MPAEFMVTSEALKFYCLPMYIISLFSPLVPNPTVVITSIPVSPIHPVGATVTLICTVDLSPAVDVPVNVNAQWSGPSEVVLITPVTISVIDNTTRYTSAAMVNSFGRNQSGEYTCTATTDLVTMNPLINGGVGVTGMASITLRTGKLYLPHAHAKGVKQSVCLSLSTRKLSHLEI